jgi:hypothetical protein
VPIFFIDKETKTWTGKAVVPKAYFPPNVSRFNAYSMHGPRGDDRKINALYPTPGAKPDNHRLEYFQPFDGTFIDELYSETWSEAIENFREEHQQQKEIEEIEELEEDVTTSSPS